MSRVLGEGGESRGGGWVGVAGESEGGGWGRQGGTRGSGESKKKGGGGGGGDEWRGMGSKLDGMLSDWFEKVIG